MDVPAGRVLKQFLLIVSLVCFVFFLTNIFFTTRTQVTRWGRSWKVFSTSRRRRRAGASPHPPPASTCSSCPTTPRSRFCVTSCAMPSTPTPALRSPDAACRQRWAGLWTLAVLGRGAAELWIWMSALPALHLLSGCESLPPALEQCCAKFLDSCVGVYAGKEMWTQRSASLLFSFVLWVLARSCTVYGRFGDFKTQTTSLALSSHRGQMALKHELALWSVVWGNSGFLLEQRVVVVVCAGKIAVGQILSEDGVCAHSVNVCL